MQAVRFLMFIFITFILYIDVTERRLHSPFRFVNNIFGESCET